MSKKSISDICSFFYELSKLSNKYGVVLGAYSTMDLCAIDNQSLLADGIYFDQDDGYYVFQFVPQNIEYVEK